MKPRLVLSFIILTICSNLIADSHTFIYTFKSNPFPETITTTESTVALHNMDFKAKTVVSATSVTTSLTSEGLVLTPSNQFTTFNLILLNIPDYFINSVSIEIKSTGTTNSISMVKAGEISTNTQDITNTFTQLTQTYLGNEPFKPKIIITLNNPVTIRSITITYTDNNQTPDLQLFDNSTLINSIPATNGTIDLPTITSFNTDLHHIGWTTTPVQNGSTTLIETPVTQITIPSTATTLYALYSHPVANARPTATTVHNPTPSQNAQKITLSHTPDEESYLAYAHFYGNNVTQGQKAICSAIYANGTINSDTIYSTTPGYHTPLQEGILPITGTLTLKAATLTGFFHLDSVILGILPATSVTQTYYSSLPETPFHIRIDENNPDITEELTAQDNISYSMTIDDSRYFFFSLPFDVPFSGISFTPVSGPFPEQYYSGYENNAYIGDWVISDYDESTNSWRDIELTDLAREGLHANHGYTIGLAKNNTTAKVTFASAHSASGITISPDKENLSLETQYTSNNDPEHHGWNLLGNPYYSTLSSSAIHAPYLLIPDNSSTDIHDPYTLIYIYAEPDDEKYATSADIPPFTPFFVQTPLSTMNITPVATSDIMASAGNEMYHFNIVCQTRDNKKSVLTILSNDSLTDDYEIGYDLLAMAPEVSITHNGLAIYASNIGIGDTIPVTLPASGAKLSVGQNIYIPENWGIKILPDIPAITIIDNTVSGVENVEESSNDFPISIYTIDGRLIYTGETTPTSLTPGLYIIKTSTGKTYKTIIK